VEDRGAGWLRDQEGKNHRMKKLGFETRMKAIGIETKAEKKRREGECPKCMVFFDTEKGLKSHHRLCRKEENMSVEQLRMLRRTRQSSASRRGKTVQKIEPVLVYTCDGQLVKACAEFVYLGSQIDGTGSATPEVRRRIAKALGVFGCLRKVWKATTLENKTKASLYRAIIWSIMLYNGEVWPIKKQDMKALEGANFRMLRMMGGKKFDEHVTEAQLRRAFGLPEIRHFLSQKRMRWIGHALRRDEGDRSRQAVKRALDKRRAIWTKLVQADCEVMGVLFCDLEELAKNRAKFRKISHHSYLRNHNGAGEPGRQCEES
jgi:hypothetical protein